MYSGRRINGPLLTAAYASWKHPGLIEKYKVHLHLPIMMSTGPTKKTFNFYSNRFNRLCKQFSQKTIESNLDNNQLMVLLHS